MKWSSKRLAVGAIGLLLAFALIRGAYERATCAWYGSQTGRDTRYASFVGCTVAVGELWIPRSELRVTQ